jgi:hypothetical protein
MSAEAMSHAETGAVAVAVVGAPEAVAHSDSTTSIPCSSAKCPAVEEQDKELIAPMQLIQHRIGLLEQQMQELASTPSAGASAAAASSSIGAAVLCTPPPRQQSSSPFPTQLSIGQQLHKDALHCVFAYFSLTELPSAMRSCRAWYTAVHSLPLQNVSFYMSRPRQLRHLLTFSSSPLARHIVKCTMRDAYTADELAQFLARLPRLQSLSHWACWSTALHPKLYSSQLRELHVNFPQEYSGPPCYDSDSDAGKSLDEEKDEEDARFVAQMAHLSSASALRRLTVFVPDRCYDIQSFSLEPLECMKELESLRLLDGRALDPEQLVPIRRLPSLRTLNLDGWSEEQMLALLEDRPDCPPLQLHHFDGLDDDNLDLERATLLVRMPTLQRGTMRYHARCTESACAWPARPSHAHCLGVWGDSGKWMGRRSRQSRCLSPVDCPHLGLYTGKRARCTVACTATVGA